jgi:hypothetical protein
VLAHVPGARVADVALRERVRALALKALAGAEWIEKRSPMASREDET